MITIYYLYLKSEFAQVSRNTTLNRRKKKGELRVKWLFSRETKKSSRQDGLVGVYETPSTISAAYATFQSPVYTIQSYMTAMTSTPAAKQEVLNKFVQDKELMGLPCSYVMPKDAYSLNLVETPAVETDEVPEAMRWVLRDLISFPIEEAVIDIFELPFPRARDNVKMLYATAIRKSLIPTIESLIQDSGLVLKYIDIPELALRNIVRLVPEDLNGVALVQVEVNGGKIILCKNGQICITRSFEHKLESLLNTTEDSSSSEKALELLELEIQRSFDYLSSVFRQTLTNTIILAPGVMKQDLIQEALKNTLGADVSCLELSSLVTFEKPISKAEEVLCMLAVGAALRETSD